MKHCPNCKSTKIVVSIHNKIGVLETLYECSNCGEFGINKHFEIPEKNLTTEPDNNIYKEVIEFFGETNQINKAIEECCELSVALCHYKDIKVTKKQVAEKIADVEIMCSQLREIIGNDIVNQEKAFGLVALDDLIFFKSLEKDYTVRKN